MEKNIQVEADFNEENLFISYANQSRQNENVFVFSFYN